MHLRSKPTTAVLLLSLLSSYAVAGCGPNLAANGDVPTAKALERESAAGSEPGGLDMETDPAFDPSIVQSAELPEIFPPDFPIPDGAQITSIISLPGEEELQVFIALIMPVEEALTYYQHELPAKGWTIEEQGKTGRGMEMKVSSSAYAGELLFVAAEHGVALDVHLFPPVIDDIIPELAGDLGDSASLGESSGSFPADFPIPTSFRPLDLNEMLRAEGFELAFTYVGITEMGVFELNIALMSDGWEIGDMTLEGQSEAYVLPFTGNGGFEGYAFITSNPGQFGVDTGGAILIALAPGRP